MSAVPKPNFTYEEYLVREKTAHSKGEFYRGQIYAMAGGSPRHNTIGGNIFASLRGRLRGSNCRPFKSEQRIRISANGLSTYPDVSIVCGDLQIEDHDRDSIINPRVLIEVLSKSTDSNDRGKKFDLYRQLDSLKEYILVSQDEPHIDRFTRQEDGSWVLTVIKELGTTLEFQAVTAVLPLTEIYEDVKFGPEETPVPA